MTESVIGGIVGAASYIVCRWALKRFGPLVSEHPEHETSTMSDAVVESAYLDPRGIRLAIDEEPLARRKPWRIRRKELEAAAKTRRAKIESFQE